MYEEMPYVFALARINEQKTCLTYEEYLRYLKVWKEMPQEMKERVKKNESRQ